MREYVVENEFVKAVRAVGGLAYKLTSQTANGLPDRLVLFPPAKTVFVELKAPGKILRPLQRKRRYQLMKLGFPVLCIDRFSQIRPAIRAIQDWTPGTPFPEGIGARIPDLEIASLPAEEIEKLNLDDYGDTLEPEDPSALAEFHNIDIAVDTGVPDGMAGRGANEKEYRMSKRHENLDNRLPQRSGGNGADE